MKYITKKCPHCKFAYMLMEPSGGQDYGSPIQTCQKCGRQFIDKDYREIAVSGIRKTDTKKVSPNAIYLLVSYLIFIIPCVIVGSYDTEYFIWAIIISFLILLFLIYNIYSEYKEYDLRQEYLREETAASEARLSNYAYAHFLKEIGYDVPKKYLIPLDSVDSSNEKQ